MSLIFIDTNILIYLVDQNEPVKQKRACDVLHTLEANRCGRISAQNLAEFVHASLRKLSPPLTAQQAMMQAARFAAHFQVFPLTNISFLRQPAVCVTTSYLAMMPKSGHLRA